MTRFAVFSTLSVLFLGCTTTKIIQEAPAAAPQDAGTTTDPSDEADAGTPAAEALTTVEGQAKPMFGSNATSYAKVDANNIVKAVGVRFAMKSFDEAPADHAFQDDLVLDMPKVAQEQTLLNHLRANWLEHGHTPLPYNQAHFDFHFLRGTQAEVDAIMCRADGTMPTADKLPAGYGQPELCVDAMGYHSWPKADTAAGGKFLGSLIMGYWKGNVIFVEPMIPLSILSRKKTFTIPIGKPASAGGKTTLYPTQMVATWDDTAQGYEFEFNKLESID